MKPSRPALIFVISVVLPSLVLAALAARSVQHQRLAAERQQSLHAQSLADKAALSIGQEIARVQQEFASLVKTMLTSAPAADFDEQLRQTWPLADIGFDVDVNTRQLLSPSALSEQGQTFRAKHERVLTASDPLRLACLNPVLPSMTKDALGQLVQAADAASPGSTPAGAWATNSLVCAAPGTAIGYQLIAFHDMAQTAREGTIGRFIDDQMELLIWHRPEQPSSHVLGARLNLNGLMTRLGTAIDHGSQSGFIHAIRNERGIPVKVSEDQNCYLDPQQRLASAELGDVLPHWQVAVYAVPVPESAWSLSSLLGFFIAILVAKIGIGGWLVFRDVRREAAVAQQKTDFVSNVSHELRTPLTTIRMFAEMLAEDRVEEPGKRQQFLRTICAEAGRLTRLVNNVLTFARDGRSPRSYQMELCDLTQVAETVCADYRPSLEQKGFRFDFNSITEPITVRADVDAISQVLVNLLSNAEKYSAESKEISVTLTQPAQLTVEDRGQGVPPGDEERIFREFQRARSNCNTAGTGLGLTLARRIARDHGGDLRLTARPGGGSCFTLTLPPHA